MKKKILALCLCAALLAICVIGGTLAYFTDTDAEANVLVAGNVEIDLHESNNDRPTNSDEYEYDTKDDDVTPVEKDDKYREWLAEQPFLPTAVIEKDAWVENTGTQPLYTRVHIAVPADAFTLATPMDDRILELVLSTDKVDEETGEVLAYGDNYGAGNWTFYNLVNDTDADNRKLNTYTVEAGGEEWYVIVATYRSVLKKGEQTPPCLSSVVMFDDTQCSDIDRETGEITYTRGNGTYVCKSDGTIPVIVFAEAGQQFGFDDPFDALNKQFGDPLAADYTSPIVEHLSHS